MQTLDYIINKYNIDITEKSPFYIQCDRLVDLPELFKELNFTKGVEIGVCGGIYSEILCKSNPNLILYSVDAWIEYPIYKQFRKQKHYDKFYIEAVERLSKYPNNKIIKKWSMDAVKDFDDNSLDFVFIDANHEFQHFTNDLAEWGKKVKVGGIISGHDYGISPRIGSYCHVYFVVNGWTAAKRIHPWFVLSPKTDKNETSWMWVKE